MDTEERDREQAARIVAAARRGDRKAFDAEWEKASATARCLAEGEVRIRMLAEARRDEEVR